MPVLFQLHSTSRISFKSTGFSSFVLSGLLCDFNAGGLALLAGLLFHLSDAQQHGGHHLSDTAVKVDLLCHCDDSKPLVTPITEDVQPLAELATEPVEFVDHDGIDLTVENCLLQLLEPWPLQVVSSRLVSKPQHVPASGVAGQPALNLSPLAGQVLPDGTDTDVDGN